MTQNITHEDLIIWQEATKGVTRLECPPDVTSSQPHVVRTYPDSGQLTYTHDLHGLTIEGAYRYMMALVYELHERECRGVRIITGKSGDIRQEFPQWMRVMPFARYIAKVQLESTGGSFLLTLR